MRLGKWKTLILFLLAWLTAVGQGHAQSVDPEAIDPWFCRETGVSFIDSALPLTQFRIKSDQISNLNRPNRAEYFWPASTGSGRPVAERSVDYQELSAYAEISCYDRVSFFVEGPSRWLNPEINPNTAGWSDMNAGMKIALCYTPHGVVSGQVRAYIPTGIGERGLGTDHFSLEPSLLLNHRLHEWVTFEGEVRYWVPFSGSDFEGDMFRYGAGLVFGKQETCGLWVTPVAEIIGWVPLSGKQSYVAPSGIVVTEEARNKTVCNGMFGARVGCSDCFDIYGGYGVSLTGDRWADEQWRIELRFKF
jgi:hypothetical protein